MNLYVSAALSPLPAGAETALTEGAVVKAKGHATLYYVGAEGKRYVFPNENIFFSWYDDFSRVKEVEVSDLSKFSLAGAVQYRPGALLIKLQTDPKVYAVGANGILRWVKTEELAKKLYGEKWNLLVDDVLDSFFQAYAVGAAIENESGFSPEEEESIVVTISENLDAKIRDKAKSRAKKNLDFCMRSEKQINQIQKRSARRGIKIEGLGEEFLKQCVMGVSELPKKADKKEEKTDKKDKDDDKKITLCHIPPGNPQNKQTITVGLPAVRAHLKHGDTVGACGGGTGTDTTAPVISDVRASSTSSTSEAIFWSTNEPSTSRVLYAQEPLASATTTKSVSDSALVSSHRLNLTSLLPSTKYYFMVESKDANGNTATTTEQTFTTVAPEPMDTTAPQISSVAATSITASSTIIIWTTNEPATSIVKYAKQSLATATTTQSASDATLLTAHSLTLAPLASSTQYYFLAESKDSSGNTATSTEQTFTTLP